LQSECLIFKEKTQTSILRKLKKLIEENKLFVRIEAKSRSCSCLKKIENLVFQNTILNIHQKKLPTMDWMTGVHLSEFKNSDPIVANKVGQALGFLICIKFIF
jgi:hypothetical protein